MVDTDYLRRMANASVFGIPEASERAKITAAADEIDSLRDQITSAGTALDALGVERVVMDRVSLDGPAGYSEMTISEPNPSRKRLYDLGESEKFDQYSVQVVVDLDVILAILDANPDCLSEASE